MKKLVLFSAIILNTYLLFSQESKETEVQLPKIGIGLHVEQFKLADLQLANDLISSTKLIFTYNVNNSFRIEPNIGLINFKEPDYKSLGVHIGTGAYKMIQKGKTNIYYGVTLGYDNLSAENDESGDTYTEKTNRFNIGPKIGGELFLANHFSLSGEVGLLYFHSNTKENRNRYYDDDDNSTYSSILVDSGLIIRFYF